MNMIALILVNKDFALSQGESDFYLLQSPWIYIGQFTAIFEIQIYYLWIMQGSSEKCRKENGSKLYIISNSIIYLSSFAFAIFSYLAYTVNVDESN